MTFENFMWAIGGALACGALLALRHILRERPWSDWGDDW